MFQCVFSNKYGFSIFFSQGVKIVREVSEKKLEVVCTEFVYNQSYIGYIRQMLYFVFSINRFFIMAPPQENDALKFSQSIFYFFVYAFQGGLDHVQMTKKFAIHFTYSKSCTIMSKFNCIANECQLEHKIHLTFLKKYMICYRSKVNCKNFVENLSNSLSSFVHDPTLE